MMRIDRLLLALMLSILVLFIGAGAALSKEAPWAAADQLRRDMAKIERLLYRQPGETVRGKAAGLYSQVHNAYGAALKSPFARFSTELDDRLEAGFTQLNSAVNNWSPAEAAAARHQIWTGVLSGAYRLTMAAFEAGDVAGARNWLGIREYARAANDTAASQAMDRAGAGTLALGQARQVVERELLRIYAGEMRRALSSAAKAADKTYPVQLAGQVARATGLSRLLSGNMKARLGAEKQAKIAALFTKLASGQHSGADIQPHIAALDQAMLGYSPSALSVDERERRARLLMRFLGLVYIEYKDGVRDGKITIQMEYHEAKLFRDRAQTLLNDLQGALIEASPERFQQLSAQLKEMREIIDAKGPKTRIKELSQTSAVIVSEVFAINKDAGGHKVAFQMLPAILDEIVILARAGDYPGAEFKRLEAYSFFDPDIEQRLVPRAPTLSLKLESRFWEGSADNHGLAKLLADKASADQLAAAVKQTNVLLLEAKVILDAKLGSTGAFVQSLAIILREGLEAILVIAALIGALNAAGVSGYKPYLWGGVLAALCLSFATWYAAGHFLTISTLNRELMEGLTALLAAGVLIYVTHWIFHKAYVTDWVSYVKGKVREAAGPGRLLAITSLGFFVVYREGFETVLFYEALMIDASPGPVLGGFALGVLGTAGIAVALLYMGLKLPLQLFFKLTGFLLMFLSLIFIGVGIRGLQTAGLVSATPVPGFPEWPALQLYAGIYPVAEPLIAQAVVVLIYAAGLIWLRLQGQKSLTGRRPA